MTKYGAEKATEGLVQQGFGNSGRKVKSSRFVLR